uniref:carbohydrate kinase family protein n=1 Tax=Stappia sp. TaxID=1870903 RepID=UPI003BAB5A15
MSRIAILGNLGVDLLYQVPHLPAQHEKVQTRDLTVAGGGAPANVAHWLARLGHDVRFHAVTGTDPLSQMAVDFLARAGVDVSGIDRRDDVGPSVASIFTGGTTKAMVCGGPREADAHWRAMAARADFTSARHVHFAPSFHELLFGDGRRADLRQATVSADLNGSVSLPLLRDPDVAFTNRDELARALAGHGTPDLAGLLDKAHAEGARRLIVTDGETGVTCHRDGQRITVAPEPLSPVDRTGGGDAFAAGYLHAMLRGDDDTGALRTGLRLAGAVLAGMGSRPDTDEVTATVNALRRKS